MGYIGAEQKTKQTIDNDGWLHTGDLGWLDEVLLPLRSIAYFSVLFFRMILCTLLVELKVRELTCCTIISLCFRASYIAVWN